MKIKGRCYALKYICQTVYDILLAFGLYQLSINFNKWWIILAIFVLSEKIGNSDEVINIVTPEELSEINETENED